MKQKEIKEQIERIKQLADKWIDLIGLNHWRVTFSAQEKNGNPETTYHPGELKMVDDRWEIAMTTAVDPYYLQAKITVYLPVTTKMDDDELEEAFLHECCHIIVAPLSKPSKSKEEELVATTLARAIKRVDISYSKKHGPRNTNPRTSTRKRKTSSKFSPTK